MIAKLADACHLLDQIYLHQSDLGGWAIYHATSNADMYRLFSINGSRSDLADRNTPVIGEEPLVPGHGLYPFGTTSAVIEKYAAAHPEQKDALYNPWTVVRSAPLDLAFNVVTGAALLFHLPVETIGSNLAGFRAACLPSPCRISTPSIFCR